MAAVAIEINGLLYDKVRRTTQNVVLRGMASVIGLEVGGGPMPGGPDAPVDPGYGYPERPVDPGYGYPIGGRPHPEHPIVLPPDEPPPVGPPDQDGFLKPPPEGGWGYHNVYGWLFNPKEGVATPKA